MTYFTFAVLVAYFFYQNASTILSRFQNGDVTATTWILLVVSLLFVPLFVILILRGIRDLKEQKKKREELQKQEAERQAKIRRELYLDDFREETEDIVLQGEAEEETDESIDPIISDYDE